jgi:hypothetical protein
MELGQTHTYKKAIKNLNRTSNNGGINSGSFWARQYGTGLSGRNASYMSMPETTIRNPHSKGYQK